MGAALPVFMNTRALSAGITGVQRYSSQIRERIRGKITPVEPLRPLRGLAGHIWEQIVLPRIARKGLLWSPANSGPVNVERQVVTVHDLASIEHPEWFNRNFAAWYRWMTPRLVCRARRVITSSEFSRERLLALTSVDKSRVVVIPEGVDTCFYPRPHGEIERMRTRLNIPPGAYVLSLCTLEPRKNLTSLISAWRACSRELPSNIWLVIAGAKGAHRVFSEACLDSLPQRVRMTGFVEDGDLPALYSGALAFACVSSYEGFGLPALEAMACGTVPIVANNTSLPEVTGDAGLLVNPFDSNDIAVAIERLVCDRILLRTLQKRAIQRSKQFNWDYASAATWNILEREARASA